MSIEEEQGKIKPPRTLLADERTRRHIAMAAIVALSCGLAFGFGRLTAQKEAAGPVTIDYFQAAGGGATAAAGLAAGRDAAAGTAVPASGSVVASKKGTKYHAPWCPGASAISEANKVVFASAEEARAAGYEPAANCKGLE